MLRVAAYGKREVSVKVPRVSAALFRSVDARVEDEDGIDSEFCAGEAERVGRSWGH